MSNRAKLGAVVLVICVGLAGYWAVGDSSSKGMAGAGMAKASSEMAQAATALWVALTPEKQAKAGFDFKDEQRFDWHFIPRPRKGLPIKEMTMAQRCLAQALLASGLGQRGYMKAVTIMSLEQILKDTQAAATPVRDPELYFFSIFGKPGADATWGWRVEGHHVSLNFTIVGGKMVAGTPAFLGTNPAEAKEGPRKGTRGLGVEEDMGRALVKSMDEGQKKTAIYTAEAPKEIVTSNSRKAMIEKPVGILVSELKPEQKEMLVTLVKEYATRLRPELAEQDLGKVHSAGWEKVRFAWAGGLELGQPHYYRVQGPTFLIEYDNVQNGANHAHTVWRDMVDGDFGEDLLKKHYEEGGHLAGKSETRNPKFESNANDER